MNCVSYTLTGMDNVCKESSFGGVKAVYVAPYADIKSVTAAKEGEVNNKIQGIEMQDGKKFLKYALLKSTSGLTSTLNTSETSASYFTNEVTLQFMKMETSKRMEMMALMMTPCAVIVEDGNGLYWYLGFDNYVEASAGSAQTGTATGDSNHYELTLTDTSAELPMEVPADVLTSVID